MKNNLFYSVDNFWNKIPYAKAELHGSTLVPRIKGTTYFYPVRNGTVVVIDVSGLPRHTSEIMGKAATGPFGFHIHEGGSCGADGEGEAFMTAGSHCNPLNTYHPEHAGDLPVLFSNHGFAFMAVFTDRFKPKEVVGKTVLIHQSPDDFRTQPSGNAGVRIACGIIEKI